MNKPLKIIGLLVALIGVNGIFILLAFSSPKSIPAPSASGSTLESQDPFLNTLERKTITISTSTQKSTLLVYLAKTPEEHYHGLSWTTPLKSNEGMLFLYPAGEIQPRFVMRDMKYNLDISFYDKSGHIISTHKNLPPCTPDMCPEVGPTNPTPIHYVLETIPQNQDILSFSL